MAAVFWEMDDDEAKLTMRSRKLEKALVLVRPRAGGYR